MTPAQRIAAQQMYITLKNMPCSCQHNVLYAGMKVDQFVTKQCGPCRVTELWELAKSIDAEGRSTVIVDTQVWYYHRNGMTRIPQSDCVRYVLLIDAERLLEEAHQRGYEAGYQEGIEVGQALGKESI